MPAPCFKGRRQHSHGVIEQFVWFCNTSITHTWNVDKSIQGVPGVSPGVWKVASGTSMTVDERGALVRAGFVFNSDDSIGVMGPPYAHQQIHTPSHVRPSHRDGKLVSWRSKLNKDFKERIHKAVTENGEVVRENIIIPHEVHVFHVRTTGSMSKGLTYSVLISEFPRCTCLDFTEREARKSPYMPCKHIYFVFIVVLGLTEMVHQFMHQAALTKVELFQALGGRRNPSSM